MFNALKNMSKGILMLIISIICLPIIIIVFVAIMQSCGNSSSYSGYEKKMEKAAISYLKEKKVVPTSSNVVMVTLDTLVAEGYIKSPEKALKDSSCEGTVYSRKNGIVEELGLEGTVVYNTVLKCEKYSTNTLISNVMNDLTTSDSGLYDYGSYYYYKGDNVKNYVKFFGNTYRIVDIDRNNVIRLVKVEKEPNTRAWDNKYNKEINSSYGKSIYKDSVIRKSLLNDYSNTKRISTSAQSQIVSYNVCIGKRSKNDISISRELDCNEVLSNEVVGLLNVSDYARASGDPDCNTIIDKSCKNYNYLSKITSGTWLLNSITETSYQVYYMSYGIAHISNASEYNTYNLVIHIDGNISVKSGSGVENNPYVIE